MEIDKIVFFEGGYRGGSVNRLKTLLDNWNSKDLKPSLVTLYRVVMAKQLLMHPVLEYGTSINWPTCKETEPFSHRLCMLLPTWYFIKYFIATSWLLVRRKYRVVYYNNTPYMHIPSIICAALFGRKIICHLRDTINLTKGELFVSRWIDCFVVLSNYAKNHYKRQLGNKARLEVVYDGVDLNKYHKSKYDGIVEKETHIAVCVGTLSQRKGQDLCIKALSIVLRTHSSARLVLAGSGEEEKSLRALANSLGVEKNVEFNGHVNDVPALLAQASIGILASRREGFPNSVMEYMAAMLPVIVSEMGGISELVQNGASGYIIPQEDYSALACRWTELLDNEERRRVFGTVGRAIVEEDRFSIVAEQHYVSSIIKEVA